MSKVWLVCGLNCYDTHAVEVYNNGGELVYGTAIGPDGKRHSHVWVERNGGILDKFEWTYHVKQGTYYMPDGKYVSGLIEYLEQEV